MTGMKGTLKLSSVAEEEKSKLVPDEETDAPPPLVFLSAMAADPPAVTWLYEPGAAPQTGNRSPRVPPHFRTCARGPQAGELLRDPFFLPEAGAAQKQ